MPNELNTSTPMEERAYYIMLTLFIHGVLQDGNDEMSILPGVFIPDCCSGGNGRILFIIVVFGHMTFSKKFNLKKMKRKTYSIRATPDLLIFKLTLGVMLAALFFYGESNAYMVGDNPYRRIETLDSDGKYVLEWQVDNSAERITFNVTVETTGYVGFGLSAKGKMSGADIVIGGVLPNGQSYFSDRHAVGNQLPEIDPSQDWELHEARENGTHTFLSFSRALDTCDPQDYPLVDDKISLIWAYSERDDEVGYHYSTRGEHQVHLLSPDYTPRIDRDPKTNNPIAIHSPYNENVKVWTWQFTHVMSRLHTDYLCFLRKGPILPRKQHMIGFDVRFNDEISRKHLHHVIIAKCRAPQGFSAHSLFERHVGQSQSCIAAGGRSNSVQQTTSGPIRSEYCTDYLHGFGVGGRINFFPPHVGTPFGEDPEEYYLFQMHYDNPEERSGIRVGVNVDVFYTPQLRRHEGDEFVIRHETPGLPGSHLIPPSSIAQKTYSTCGSECSKKILPKEGIRIYAVLLHTHNSGAGVRLRHFRNNRELTPIATEDNFSFDYQQVRVLPKEAHVLPGDQVVVECTADNTWTNGTVVGGFGTRQEMCAGWFFYYNRLSNFMICASEIDSPEFRESFLGIQNFTWSTPHLEYLVDSPRQLAGLPVSKVSDMLDWTVDKREEFNEFLLTHPHSNRCPVEKYAREHTVDENGEPVDLELEENLPVPTLLPSQTGYYNPPQQSCSAGRRNRYNYRNNRIGKGDKRDRLRV